MEAQWDVAGDGDARRERWEAPGVGREGCGCCGIGGGGWRRTRQGLKARGLRGSVTSE